METLIAIILAGAVITFIGYPLFKPRFGEEVQPEPEETVLDEIVSQKESTLSAIAELDFDHAMGNLSEADYQDLRDKYKLKALALLKKEDELAKPADEATEAAPEEPKRKTKGVCGSCGASVGAGDRFCANCGNPLGKGCPNCGADHGPDDAFCASCGQPLASAAQRR